MVYCPCSLVSHKIYHRSTSFPSQFTTESMVFKTSRVACYANDTKIFKSIDSITDCNALKSDLNDLVSWSESSGLIFNQSKCKYQWITRKKSPVQPTFIINETPLESCDTEKDLGVTVFEGLNVINGRKCNKVLNVITFCPKCNNNLP